MANAVRLWSARVVCFSGSLLALAFGSASTQAVVIPTVTIGNPGNAGETQVDGTFGAVGYEFQMGKHEVSNAQYVEFLNAVDPTGANARGLYSGNMASNTRGGIVFNSGAGAGAKYAVKSPAAGQAPGGTDYTYGNKPVVFVNFWDAARFANWLHNGQGSGDTENGAYTLTSGGISANTITRNAGAQWFLPNENEWYKAAYYDPNKPGGAGYYDYPTGTDATPDNNLPSSDSGNSINHHDGIFPGYTNGDDDYPYTGVGAYTLSESPYGTFDQGGNVWDWNETIIGGSNRGWRGGAYSSNLDPLGSDFRAWGNSFSETQFTGFRVAGFANLSAPEPSTWLGTSALLALLLLYRKRLRKTA